MDTNQADSLAAQLIQRDLATIQRSTNQSPIIYADMIDNNPFYIEAGISGSEQTAYENGIFQLNIKLPHNYPFSPPTSIIFTRAIMHPNVNEWGIFTSDLVKTQWTPAMSIKSLLEHISALLCFPDVYTTECDLTRAHSYDTDKENFNKLAREYSVKYAAAYNSD